ncbi:hypothetical protein BH23GEM8_BH23GEM8_08330 [soil metagenome]
MARTPRSIPAAFGSEQTRMLIGAGYGVALMILFFSISDVVMRMLPFRAGDTAWRIGAVGTVSGNIATWLLALLIICLTAFLLGHRLVLRTLAVLRLVSAVVTFLVVPFFVLDFLELRRAVRADTLLPFDVTMWRATLAILSTAGVLAWIGIGSWRTTNVRGKRTDGDPAAAAMMVSPPKVAAGRSR